MSGSSGRQYNDFTWRFRCTGSDNPDNCQCSVLVQSNQGADFLNCGCNVAVSPRNTYREIRTSKDLVCRTIEGREKKIGRIIKHIKSYKYENAISRPSNDTELVIVTKVTKGPFGFLNVDTIREKILSDVSTVTKSAP